MADNWQQQSRYKWLLGFYLMFTLLFTAVAAIPYGIVNVVYDDRRADQIEDHRQAEVRGEFWAYAIGRKELPANPTDSTKLAADLKPLLVQVEKPEGLQAGSRLPKEIEEGVAAPRQYGDAPNTLDLPIFGIDPNTGDYFTEGPFSDEFKTSLVDVVGRPSDFIQQARGLPITYAHNPIVPLPLLLLILLGITSVGFWAAVGLERKNYYATHSLRQMLQWDETPYLRPKTKMATVALCPHVFLVAAAINNPRSLLFWRHLRGATTRFFHSLVNFRVRSRRKRKAQRFEHPYPERLTEAQRLYDETEALYKKHPDIEEVKAARDAALQVLKEYQDIPTLWAKDAAKVIATRMVRTAVDLRVEPATWKESQKEMMAEKHAPEIAALRKAYFDGKRDGKYQLKGIEAQPEFEPLGSTRETPSEILNREAFERMLHEDDA
jgi:hypothetical protein